MNWQDLSVNPRTCPCDTMPRLCTYNGLFARPATAHRKTNFRLALSNRSPRCVQALFRFRMGCHNLPVCAAGLTCHGHKDFDHFAKLDHRVMNITLCLSVRACSTFVIGTLACLNNMRGQWFNSCGRLTLACMGLPNLSQIVWAYIKHLPEGGRASDQP